MDCEGFFSFLFLSIVNFITFFIDIRKTPFCRRISSFTCWNTFKAGPNFSITNDILIFFFNIDLFNCIRFLEIFLFYIPTAFSRQLLLRSDPRNLGQGLSPQRLLSNVLTIVNLLLLAIKSFGILDNVVFLVKSQNIILFSHSSNVVALIATLTSI